MPEQLILDQCNGKHTVADIALLTRSRDFHTSMILFQLHNRNLVTFSTPEEALAIEEHRNSRFADIDEAELEVHRLMTRSGMLLKKGIFQEAWDTIRKVQTLRPDELAVEERIEKVQTHILSSLQAKGIRTSAIPFLKLPLEEISNLNLTPKEGFILTRINGHYDIQNILALAPMHVVDAYLVFDSLMNRDIIGIQHGDPQN